METRQVLKLLARGFGAVVLTAFTIYVQEEFAKGLTDSIKK